MRDELIFIAGGVIVVTLLLANFLLPLLAPNRNKDTSVEMTEITIEVLRRTVEELTGRVTPDNRRAVLMIIEAMVQFLFKRPGRNMARVSGRKIPPPRSAIER